MRAHVPKFSPLRSLKAFVARTTSSAPPPHIQCFPMSAATSSLRSFEDSEVIKARLSQAIPWPTTQAARLLADNVDVPCRQCARRSRRELHIWNVSPIWTHPAWLSRLVIASCHLVCYLSRMPAAAAVSLTVPQTRHDGSEYDAFRSLAGHLCKQSVEQFAYEPQSVASSSWMRSTCTRQLTMLIEPICP